MQASARNLRLRYLALIAVAVIAFSFQCTVWAENISDLLKQPNPLRALSTSPWILVVVNHFFTASACLVLGLYVAWVRSEDRRAWLLLFLLLSFTVNIDGIDKLDRIMQWHSAWRHAVLVYRSVQGRSWPIWMVLFALYFPKPVSIDSRRPYLKWLVLGPMLASFSVGATFRVLNNEGLMHHPLLQPWQSTVAISSRTLYWSGMALFLAILVSKARKETSPNERRRRRVMLTGLAVAVIPPLCIDLVVDQLRIVRENEIPALILVPAVAALALFPITLAYVTVVQRALDVGVILRESLQYALARRGVVVLQSIVSLIVIIVVALWTGEVGLSARFAITAAGVLVVLALGFGAERLASWIDRRFFREANQAERSLADLASRISSVVGLKALATTVEESIRQALHVPNVALFLREQGSFSNARSTLEKEHCSLIRSLERSKGVLKEEDHRELQSLGSQIVVPVARNNELLAFLSLGARKAEAPYTRSDIALLQSVASQTALAIDNTRLTESIAAEVAEREILTRELAIAREVQSRLFPQVHPQRAGLDYYGHCRPAREVGGDYYDYFELPNDGLGIAIGDVAGKGVPAALLMASLQAALRGQTVAGSASLPTLFGNINHLIYATTPANRYATFFYAQYDGQLGTLTYINAGHNAPILLRSLSGEQKTIRLGVGGPPIGLLPECPFEEGIVQLCPGDLLGLYTDGISEAMNEKDEEWGEDCLIATLAGSDGRPSAALVEHVFEAADRFADGAPQHDDMTFMVFRFA